MLLRGYMLLLLRMLLRILLLLLHILLLLLLRILLLGRRTKLCSGCPGGSQRGDASATAWTNDAVRGRILEA